MSGREKKLPLHPSPSLPPMILFLSRFNKNILQYQSSGDIKAGELTPAVPVMPFRIFHKSLTVRHVHVKIYYYINCLNIKAISPLLIGAFKI